MTYPFRPPPRPKPPPVNPLPPPALREQLDEFHAMGFGENRVVGEWIAGTPGPTIVVPTIIIPPPPWSEHYDPALDPDYEAPAPEPGVIEEEPKDHPPPERGPA